MFYNFLNSLKTFHLDNNSRFQRFGDRRNFNAPPLDSLKFSKNFLLYRRSIDSLHEGLSLIGIQRWFVRFSLMLNGVNNKINARWNDVNGLYSDQANYRALFPTV